MSAADASLFALCADILTKVPEPFDVEKVQVLYPVRYEQSMNTVLAQECIRFNGVIETVRGTLSEVQRAVRGITVMSAELEAVATAVVQSRVPAAWKAVAYPSVKPLASWVLDLAERIAFLQAWIDAGPPAVFWVSGFFFTQSFLTGTRQNFARAHAIPIDEIAFEFRVLPPAECDALAAAGAAARPPADGAYIRGLFLQGARWDASAGVLAEALPRQLDAVLPIMHLLPTRVTPGAEGHGGGSAARTYECPVYKTSERAGTLSTTGHSTNLVMHVLLPISAQHSPSHWVKRGTALISQQDT
jgi:dynein heavy chain